MDKDGRSLKQMSHEMPFKKLIWKFSRKSDSRKYSRKFSQVSLTTSYSWNIRETLCTKLKNMRFGPFNSQLSLHMKWVMKTPRKHVFHIKITWKTLKNMGDTNHFQKQTKRTKIFLVWSTYGWTHTHHIWTCITIQMK